MTFFDYSLTELQQIARDSGCNPIGARDLFGLVYRHGLTSLDDATNISQTFLRKLAKPEYEISVPLQQVKSESAPDGTTKYCFKLSDGLLIESVLIPGSQGRNTLCVSSQAGCARGCAFCATATMGLQRNLTVAEIVGQLISVNRQPANTGNRLLDNVVLMGMGEPLDNFDNVLKAVRILGNPAGLGFSDRKITLSTCGVVPQMRSFAAASGVQLAVSLHAADDDLRSRLMPVNRRYPLGDLLECCREITASQQRKIMFEYALIRGVNDTQDQAEKLARRLQGIDCKINLLAFNAAPGLPFAPALPESIQQFRAVLSHAGLLTMVRRSRGEAIAAACGQLAAAPESLLVSG